MKYKVAKDKKRRLLVAQDEKQRLIWKMMKKNVFLLKELRNFGSYTLNKNTSYFVQIRNHCILSGRSRGLISDYGVSRLMFKYLINQGYFEGINKCSW